MPTFPQRVRGVFLRAWRAYGRPVLSAVRPRAAWSLPAGWAYYAIHDVVLDAAGNVRRDGELAEYWVSDMVYIVPQTPSADQRALVAAGVAPDGTVEVFILPADVATVRDTFAIEMGGLWYDVVGLGAEPPSMTNAWYAVRLQRRS